MDMDHFDALARSIGLAATRRSALRGLAGAVLAARFGAGATTAAAGCSKDGSPCDRKRRGQCCSGTCKKVGKQHSRCQPTPPDALGCTVRDDFCAGRLEACPANPNGGCIVRDDGRPFCAGSGQCFPCKTDGDCDDAFMAKGGVCIKCPICGKSSGKSFCAFPPPLS